MSAHVDIDWHLYSRAYEAVDGALEESRRVNLVVLAMETSPGLSRTQALTVVREVREDRGEA
jgi:hypothetical protein